VKLFGDRQSKTFNDEFELEQQPDGSFGACYFCGASVRSGEDFAVLAVERIDPSGDPIHSVCHGACVERAREI
jgi:hypothetical protein